MNINICLLYTSFILDLRLGPQNRFRDQLQRSILTDDPLRQRILQMQ